MEKDDQKRMIKFIEKQIQSGKSSTDDSTEEFKQPLERPEGDAPLVLKVKFKLKKPLKPTLPFIKLSQIGEQPKIIQEVVSDDEQSIRR